MENSQAESSANRSDGSVLNREANRAIIDTLYADGFLSQSAYEVALNCVSRQRNWWTWVNRCLLFAGAALALAGIVFFFAYNWNKLPAMAKFSLVEFGLIACLVGVWKVGLDKIGGQVLLLSASMIVGVFLAVFGQVYQTGADAYQLFVGWAVLILGWVLLGRFGALWILWVALVNTGLMLYFSQIAEPLHLFKDETMFMILALVNATVLAAREIGYLKFKMSWLAQGWLRWTLLILILTYLFIPSAIFIADLPKGETSGLPLFVLIAVIMTGFGLYRFVSADLFALTQCLLAFCALVLIAIGRVLLEGDNPFTWLFYGLIVVITVSAAAFLLRVIGNTITREAKSE